MNKTDLVIPVQGMTCSNCVKHVETVLNRLDGVQQVSVSLPTEKAFISVDADLVNRQDVVKAIESTGFKVPAEDKDSTSALESEQQAVADDKRFKLLFGIVLTLPLFILSMGRDFGIWGEWSHAAWVNWLMFALATPVQFYVGREYYIGAYKYDEILPKLKDELDKLIASR